MTALLTCIVMGKHNHNPGVVSLSLSELSVVRDPVAGPTLPWPWPTKAAHLAK